MPLLNHIIAICSSKYGMVIILYCTRIFLERVLVFRAVKTQNVVRYYVIL